MQILSILMINRSFYYKIVYEKEIGNESWILYTKYDWYGKSSSKRYNRFFYEPWQVTTQGYII